MRLILSLALAASLSACAAAVAPIANAGTPLPPDPAPVAVLPAVSAALTRADAAFNRLRPAAERVLPLLPEPYRTRGFALLDQVGRLLGVARRAGTLADQLAAVRRADELVRQLGQVTATR